MGIYDRDYYRDGPSLLDRMGQQGVTIWIIVITTVIFLMQYLPDSPVIALGIYDPRFIAEGQVWRLLTSVFLHAGIFHLFFNMLVLYFFGPRLEEIYGGREFLTMYLVAGVGANLINLGAQYLGLTPMTAGLGASGAIMALLVVFAFHFPNQRVLLFFILPMPIWMLVVLYALFDIFGALGGRPGANIGFVVHLAGALLGTLYYQSGIRLTGLFKRQSPLRVRPRLRVVVPQDDSDYQHRDASAQPSPPRNTKPANEHLEAKLDAVLEKVSKYGQECLTPEERDILFRASEIYKNRRK